MPGSPIKIGPFTNGLNTLGEPTTVADTECIELLNMDLDLDGSLVNRPPVTSTAMGFTGGALYLGTFVSPTSGSTFFIYQTGTVCRAYNAVTNSWTTILSNVLITSAVQYLNKMWLVADAASASNGGSWDDSAGFTAVAAIPRGVSAVVYKERFFVATGKGSTNPSRVNFSNAANFSTWTGTDFFDVNNGDGQSIVKIYAYQGYIVVFKENSTFSFGYDSLPSKAVVQLQSGAVGIATAHALAEYENTLFIMHGNNVYSINNWNWDQVNIKVPFIYYSYKAKTSWSDFTLSVVGNRLICRFYDNFYIYGLKTRAFSLWRFNQSSFTPDRLIRFPYLDTTTGQTFYVSGAYDKSEGNIYRFIDDVRTTNIETFDVAMTTKTYDLNVPYTFKRLHHWGVDILSKTVVNYKVFPTVYSIPVRWSQISGVKHWSEVNTWGRPISVDIDVTDSASTSNPANVRIFVRLLKSLRFRQISFRVATTVDGSTTTGPFRIFSITAFTSNKQLVPEKIN